jgi:hypothetical protein
LRLPLALYRCTTNGHEFKEPIVAGGYGILQMWSSTPGRTAIEEAATDPVFDEVLEILRTIPEYAALDDGRRLEAFDAVFGVSCDPDPDGMPYRLNAHPCCPQCGSCKTKFVCIIEPPEYVEAAIPYATHREWFSMTRAERRERLRVALQEHLHPSWPSV